VEQKEGRERYYCALSNSVGRGFQSTNTCKIAGVSATFSAQLGGGREKEEGKADIATVFPGEGRAAEKSSVTEHAYDPRLQPKRKE